MLMAGEAGKLLGLSARQVYAIADAIGCYRYGEGKRQSVRFEEADVLAYKAKAKCQSQSTTPVASFSSSTKLSPAASLPGSELTSFFQKAGRKLKRTSTTAGKQRGSTTSLLAASSPSL